MTGIPGEGLHAFSGALQALRGMPGICLRLTFGPRGHLDFLERGDARLHKVRD